MLKLLLLFKPVRKLAERVKELEARIERTVAISNARYHEIIIQKNEIRLLRAELDAIQHKASEATAVVRRKVDAMIPEIEKRMRIEP